MKKFVLTLVVCAGVVAIVIASPLIRGAANQTAPVEIKIDNFSFTPVSVTVSRGTQVRWTNRDDIPHTVVGEDHSFRSKALDTDQQFIYTFSKPGTYNYFCSLHPKMTATVVVQ